jgi:predicted nucleotidyltransferase
MPTALELGPEGWRLYAQAFTRRRSRKGKKGLKLEERERILGEVKRAADLVKAKFGAKRVILFGSMAHEAWFTPDSDIDIAVEGLKTEDYWRAWEMLEEEIFDRPVDLIEIESASESLRESIERQGIAF